jgi:hypothetical protein
MARAYYSTNDVASCLGISVKKARDLIRKEMPYIDVGSPRRQYIRVAAADFEQWCAAKRIACAGPLHAVSDRSRRTAAAGRN